MLKSINLNDNEIVLVISEINNIKYLENINELSKKYSKIIINGNLFKNNFDFLDKLNNNVLYCVGDKDFVNAKKENFIKIFDYYNRYELNYNNTKYLICCGGYQKNMEEIEYSFIKSNWHSKYVGDKGYIISNYPKDLDKKYFKFSCAIGSDNNVYCQEITKYGLKKLFKLYV